MATIKKRADELQSGDIVLHPVPDQPYLTLERTVFLYATPGGVGVLWLQFVPIDVPVPGGAPTLNKWATPRSLPAQHRFDVEVREAVPLTLAQQHAEELLAIVRETVSGDCTPETLERGRELLSTIEPPAPVTVAELLEVLEEVRNGPVPVFGSGRGARADDLLKRARRAGQWDVKLDIKGMP